MKLCLIAVMNLAEGVDVVETENRIAEYQKENYQEILENQAKQVSTGSSDKHSANASSQQVYTLCNGLACPQVTVKNI